MAKHHIEKEETKKRKEKKGGIFSRVGRFFSEHSNGAKNATIILFILILLAIISGIFTYYLATPAKELYISESQFIKETREIYSYEVGSDERLSQETRAEEASEFYGSIMDKYMTDSNSLIRGYASISSNFFKGMIAVLLILPFVAIFIMFIGNPINFIFATINMVIVIPAKTVTYLFKSFRNDKNSETKVSSKSKLKAA